MAETSLFQTAAHEVGHALGLHHAQYKYALMNAFYDAKKGSEVKLSHDDITGLHVLYGMLWFLCYHGHVYQ